MCYLKSQTVKHDLKHPFEETMEYTSLDIKLFPLIINQSAV